MTTKQSARSVPKVYLIDDDPVVTFLLVDLTESVNLPYVVFENAVKFLEQDLEGLARIFHKTGRISLNPLIKLGLRQ